MFVLNEAECTQKDNAFLQGKSNTTRQHLLIQLHQEEKTQPVKLLNFLNL